MNTGAVWHSVSGNALAFLGKGAGIQRVGHCVSRSASGMSRSEGGEGALERAPPGSLVHEVAEVELCAKQQRNEKE
jgi:hypothetical protein